MEDFLHTADRPSWHCRICGDPWPCASARASLVATLSPTLLAMYMWSNYEEAILSGNLVTEEAAQAYDRFILWARR
jgi:hypothetical protein